MEGNVQSTISRPAPADTGAPAMLDIAALTRRMTEGDDMAWCSFYDEYFDRLWRYLLVVADGNEDVARESLQAALVRVARHIKVFHDENVFWSWLTVLARSAHADETKKGRRYFSFLARFLSHKEAESETDNDADERLKNALSRHITSLSPDEQRLLEQKYFGHRAVRDIAYELHSTEKAVESKLSRIRRKLKDAVLKDLKDET